MKTIIFYLLLLCLCNYSCNSSHIKTQTGSQTVNTSDIDSLITITNYGDYGIRYSSGSYLKDEATFYEKEKNAGAISYAMKYTIGLSQQTLDMLEKDGGMQYAMWNVLKRCLTNENFNELSKTPTFFSVNVTMVLDGSKVTGRSFRISNENLNKIKLSAQEINRLFDYVNHITIVYTGKEFRDKISPIGWSFPVRSPLKTD